MLPSKLASRQLNAIKTAVVRSEANGFFPHCRSKPDGTVRAVDPKFFSSLSVKCCHQIISRGGDKHSTISDDGFVAGVKLQAWTMKCRTDRGQLSHPFQFQLFRERFRCHTSPSGIAPPHRPIICPAGIYRKFSCNSGSGNKRNGEQPLSSMRHESNPGCAKLPAEYGLRHQLSERSHQQTI